MRLNQPTRFYQITIFFFLSLIGLSCPAQIIQVEVVGGSTIATGSTVTINAGNTLDFNITNIESGNCENLKINDINIANTTDFSISPNDPTDRIRPASCLGDHNLNFKIDNISSSCISTSTLVTIEIDNQTDFTFTLQVNSSPEIFVLGGTPNADIIHGDTVTSDVNGTFFGSVEEGASVSRTYAITNIGNCNLDISSITSSNGDFTVSSTLPIPHTNLIPYSAFVFEVTFTGPISGTGTQTSVISIGNTDNTTFTFTVGADMYDITSVVPGGILAEFRLWLKSTRGVTESASKVSSWADLGTNGKDATQSTPANQPTYLDNSTDNINFNPVIKFENDGSTIEQYLSNPDDGFYSQDIFIVMVPDASMTAASGRNTIFGGTYTGLPGDITGVGFGDYHAKYTNEVLSYSQAILSPVALINGVADDVTTSYSKAGIINVRNNLAVTAQELLYNSDIVSTTTVNDIPYLNVGFTEIAAPFTVYGSEYWIGKNMDTQGNLNGRIAEIFTFAERLNDADRQKIESYLGIKYGITLGASTEADKNYISSFDTTIWDITVNAGFNYDVAGIGKDSSSDLNQKQSKSLNLDSEVSISLGNIFETNNLNTNEFKEDGDFLVWGNNNAAFSGTSTNTVTVATGITTTITRVDRKWKIVETNEHVNGDVETVYVSIPTAAFSSFTKTATEEYALIVSDNANFSNNDIIDVIPLRTDGASNLQTWYDFDGTKFFTFGKVAKLSENHAIDIASGDYLVGESDLNLNADNFTISAWLKCDTNASTRTVMSKGEKLQFRLNTSGNIEIYIDNAITPKMTSTMDIDDDKWHHIAFIYDSGTILLYVDGVLDNSVQNIVHPTPNFNNFCIGALFIDKNNITNPLLGDIDEVYVWDLALNQTQVRFLMNQEVERFDITGTDFVGGKSIPQSSSSNEMASITWSHLRAYYDFNSFYGSTVEGLTDERYFLRLKYLDKDKTLIDSQTAPLPYVTLANGNWDTAGTWVNNSDMPIPNSLSLDGVTTIDWNIVEIAHDVASGDRDISLLGLIQTAGTLTIADPNEFLDEKNSGQGLSISHYLELDGIIDLVGESQLVQAEGSIVDADSGGFIEKDQQGTANGYNYNYWSSSVGPISGNNVTRGTGLSATNSNHSISNVLNDGTLSAFYQSLIFSTAPNGSGTPPPPGLARTISTHWLYKFYGAEDDYYSWAKIDETSTLAAGEGFTMKGTSGAVSISTEQNYVFTGTPHNGEINLTLNNSSTEVDRLIGNPYPSAIDAEEFILDNLSIADGGSNPNGTIFNGALYFWDHFGEVNSHALGDYVGGYATRNLTGGTAAISNDARINADLSAGSKIPGQYIPVNQGFFVTTAIEGFNNDNGTAITTVDGGDIVFKNSQRVFATEDGSTSLFVKSSDKKNKSTANTNKDQTQRIKLMYQSPKGYHRQILIGANKNASTNFDMGYDAFMTDVTEEDMYWYFNDNKFVIQGVNVFDTSQEFKLGLIVKQAGIIKIKLDTIENINENIALFIKDATTGETFSIKNNSYDLFLDPGEYNDRFSLVFKNEISLSTLETDNKILNNVLVYHDSQLDKLKLVNKYGVHVSNISLYNILGQHIIEADINSSKNETIPFTANAGTYIVKLKTEHGISNKKIIIN